MEYQERRKHERYRVSISVEWGRTPECVERDRITSFSVGGCFIQTRQVGRRGDPVFIRFWLSPAAETLLRGEVRYYLEKVGLGVEFRGLTDGDRENLRDLFNFYYDDDPV